LSITCEIEQLIVRMAARTGNRIVGASGNLGHEISDQHSNFSRWHLTDGPLRVLTWSAVRGAAETRHVVRRAAAAEDDPFQ
jgi:hypothetical protein